jgi:hypothetical protein
MKWKSSAPFDLYADFYADFRAEHSCVEDFYAEVVADAGTIKRHFVLVPAETAPGRPRGFQAHRATSSEYARICPC